MKRSENLDEIFKDLKLLITDLYHIIIDYDKTCEWELASSNTCNIVQGGKPWGIVSDEKYLYACVRKANIVLIYNLNGEVTKTLSTAPTEVSDGVNLFGPVAIELDRNENRFYIAEKQYILVYNALNLNLITSWKLPFTKFGYSNYRGITLDDFRIYVTMADTNRIFLCRKGNGEVLKRFGTHIEQSEPSKFNKPRGIIVVSGLTAKQLYVCDNGNHRIQILTEDTGNYITHWGTTSKPGSVPGQFRYPGKIYESVWDETILIGDERSVQIFTKEGKCLQRIGDQVTGCKDNQFYNIFGICVINGTLYVSDCANGRIQVFRAKEC